MLHNLKKVIIRTAVIAMEAQMAKVTSRFRYDFTKEANKLRV